MADKCEWKDLEIDNLPPDILTGDYEFEYMSKSIHEWMSAELYRIDKSERIKLIENLIAGNFEYHYRKLEPAKPLIVKSGNTWVAYYDGVDYLYLRIKNNIIDDDLEKNLLTSIKYPSIDTAPWKPFSEIELTDEIALLRPMVKIDGIPDKLYTLIYSENTTLYLVNSITSHHRYFAQCRLATAKELS